MGTKKRFGVMDMFYNWVMMIIAYFYKCAKSLNCMNCVHANGEQIPYKFCPDKAVLKSLNTSIKTIFVSFSLVTKPLQE